MTAKLPPNQMVCVPCHRCGRDQFVITDAAGQPAAYDGSGMSASGLSLEEGIHRLLDTECADCDRIRSLDAPFIIEGYWLGRLVSTFEKGAAGQCDWTPEPSTTWVSHGLAKLHRARQAR